MSVFGGNGHLAIIYNRKESGEISVQAFTDWVDLIEFATNRALGYRMTDNPERRRNAAEVIKEMIDKIVERWEEDEITHPIENFNPSLPQEDASSSPA